MLLFSTRFYFNGVGALFIVERRPWSIDILSFERILQWNHILLILFMKSLRVTCGWIVTSFFRLILRFNFSLVLMHRSVQVKTHPPIFVILLFAWGRITVTETSMSDVVGQVVDLVTENQEFEFCKHFSRCDCSNSVVPCFCWTRQQDYVN